MSLLLLAILFVIVSLMISMSIKVCERSERLAISRLGIMMPLRGPGLIIILPTVERAKKIKIGDRAIITDEKSAQVQGISIPISTDRSLPSQTPVRIVGFIEGSTGSIATVEQDADPSREIRCEKCGHTIQL